MKAKKLLLLCALLAPLFTLTAHADDPVEVDGIMYYLFPEGEFATVTTGSYSGPINIPGSITYGGIAYTVTSIGDLAFYDCGSLTSVTISEPVTKIGESAFSGCSSLTSVTIPVSVTSIGVGAFYGCISLTSVAIPESVTSIGSYAFNYCSSLTSVTIPESVTSIGEGAFMGCSRLTSVNIPESVTSIGYSAFSECSSLTSVAVDENNKVYDSRNGCNAIIETSTNMLIAGCSATNIPESVTGIGDGAFAGCSLTSVTIPESVTSIGRYAFNGCSSLTSVTIPESVTSIGEFAFSSCSRLTSVTIPESVTSIGEYVFFHCSSLTSIIVDEKNMVYNSRNDCNAIIETSTNMLIAGCSATNIPESVTGIGDGAFAGCSLTSVTIPESVTSIGRYAFEGCSSLTSVTIPVSVTSIGVGAFYGCISLTSVTIPGSVTSIGDDAFYGCSSLTTVIVGMKEPLEIWYGTFEYVNFANATLYVPLGSKLAYEAAVVWKGFKEIVEYASLEELLKTLGVMMVNVNKDKDDAIYEFNGRRLSSGHDLPKGVYIVNGRKVIVK